MSSPDAAIREPITRAELIAKLRVTPAWFDSHVAAMRRDEGFPAPLINGMYDPAAVVAWQNRQSKLDANGVRLSSAEPITVTIGANDDDDAEIRAAQAAMDRLAAQR